MKVDGKFVFSGEHPIHGYPISEENAVIFLARDACLPQVLKFYRSESAARGACREHLESIDALIGRVRLFQSLDPHNRKIAGLTPPATAGEKEAPPPDATTPSVEEPREELFEEATSADETPQE